MRFPVKWWTTINSQTRDFVPLTLWTAWKWGDLKGRKCVRIRLPWRGIHRSLRSTNVNDASDRAWCVISAHISRLFPYCSGSNKSMVLVQCMLLHKKIPPLIQINRLFSSSWVIQGSKQEEEWRRVCGGNQQVNGEAPARRHLKTILLN